MALYSEAIAWLNGEFIAEFNSGSTGEVIGRSINQWQRTFARGFNQEPYPTDDIFPHPDRQLAYTVGWLLREGLERFEEEPAEPTDVVNEIGMQYARYLEAMAKAVGCTREQAAGIVARLGKAGFLWEEVER